MTAIPKPASTVVLMVDYSKIYLTKRPATMKFMGGYHVFPGGAVEEGDQLNNPEHILTKVQDGSVSLAYYIAAARELFEEVGVHLAHKIDGSHIQLSKEQEETYRRQLQKGKMTFSQFLEQEELCLDFQWLRYFGQIITPSISPIRFDTRFFLAQLPQGQMPEPDQTEIDEALWITPEDALASYSRMEIMLAPPTILTLKAIIDYQKGGTLLMSVSEEELLELLKKQKNR